MQDNLKGLIQGVVENRYDYARQYSKILLKADKTAKDEHFVKRMLEKLEEQEKHISVPANCASFVMVEDEPDIILSRYLLTMDDVIIFKKIAARHKVSQRLADLNIKKPNTVMLHGEPGTGKTTFGRYIAKSLGLPFMYVNLSYVIDSLLGSSQKNISNMFRFISSIECVCMIDEIDSIAAKRGVKNDVAELDRITIALMQEIDRLSGNAILLAATNRLDIVDPAIVSRFSLIHEVKQFSDRDREDFVQRYLYDVGMEATQDEIERLVKVPVPQRKLEQKVINFIADKILSEIENEEDSNGEE